MSVSRREAADKAAVLPILARCKADLDVVSDLDHVRPPAGAVEVVDAVAFELDVTGSLGVADREREAHMGIDDTDFLYDAFRLGNLGEVVHGG